ncbi:uncharacterized protein B0I36DRAFT_5618 [Microdochium trichocladiopsis]|uniref:DUF7514 domain-containing protein n=1 Tax=Microdochium trichocladiopsis TaxID=1682393 RepID=A0A9P8YGR8_9PEZI|nr:uncharacterized protein B0I36DRAFT_5618 [Microdochium trichocladiopsis]KAH7040099.1 hypothetical protein B0I36DRAFT_5618 [Microdochium trichocladiopsis]
MSSRREPHLLPSRSRLAYQTHCCWKSAKPSEQRVGRQSHHYSLHTSNSRPWLVAEAIRMQRSSVDLDSPSFHDISPSESEVVSPTKSTKPSVRFSDRGQTKGIMKRQAGQRRAGSISESTSHGVLFDNNGRPTALCGHLFEALAKHLAAELAPKGGLVMTPAKMATFFERYSTSADPYPKATTSFRTEGTQGYPEIEKLYDALGCEYHLVRDSALPKSKPRLPALTPAGFSRYMTISLLAYPEQEFRRLQKATFEIPILSSPSGLSDEGLQLPNELIRSLFPAKHDNETRDLFDSAMAEFLKSPRKASTSATEIPPKRSSITSFDPRRYVPEHRQGTGELDKNGVSQAPRHSVSFNGTVSDDKYKRSSISGDSSVVEQLVPKAGASRSAPATPFPASMPSRDYLPAKPIASKDGVQATPNTKHLAVPPPPTGLGLMSFPALDPGSTTSSPAVSRHNSPDILRHGMAAAGPPPPPAASPLKSAMTAQSQSPQRNETREAASAAAEVQRHRDSLVTSPSHDRGPTWEEVLGGKSGGAAPSRSHSQRSHGASSSKSSTTTASATSGSSGAGSRTDTSSRHGKRRDSVMEKRRDR